MQQLLQPYFTAIKLAVHTQGVKLARNFMVLTYKDVAYQAVNYSYRTVNQILRTDLNDIGCARQPARFDR